MVDGVEDHNKDFIDYFPNVNPSIQNLFPQLRALTSEQRTKLKSSFLHFDDLSFCEWMRSMKLVPPEPS